MMFQTCSQPAICPPQTNSSAADAPGVPAFVALGSNLDDPAHQVLDAFAALARIPGVELLACSSLYRTAPIGYADQPDFINAVAKVRTTLSPQDLLATLHAIEQTHGRRREFANAPRTLDLDLISFGSLHRRYDDLVLPHPRAHRRAFVLLPLLEIAPECVLPGLGPAADWLDFCADQSITRVELEIAAA
jgi:2-amino-4-hydroxy-6-hydroxymethyldihydropteridine diphosphokinase